jgi:hypothetical protein
LAGVAVKVAEAPAHCGLVPEVKAIDSVGVTTGLTVITTAFEVAVAGLTQVAFEVSSQVTDCPFVMEEEVNVELFVPAFVPFTFH